MTTPEPLQPGIEDRYALSPLQAGMLFHALAGGAAGVDIEQVTCTLLKEELDSASMRQAWRQLVERHAILRTRFDCHDGTAARQEVCCAGPLDIVELDWRDCCEADQEARWADLLQADRRRGFDLSRLPLMRLTLVAWAPRHVKLLWTFHHILLDGRSFPILLREVFALYDALREGRALALPPPRPYKQFIDWLGEQKFEPAEPHWRGLLQGLQAPPQIDLPGCAEATAALESWQGVVETRLSGDASAALRDFAKRHGLTVNTLLQGAWALLLHHYTGADDVIFGATRACRHSALGGAQDMAGLFINTLPLRVKIAAAAPVLPWLHGLREQQLALRDYEHTPLVRVQEWSDVSAGTPLFESILVFENQSLDGMMRSGAGDWRSRHFDYRGQTNYPLTLIAYNDAGLLLRLEYERRRFSGAASARLLAQLQTLLQGMVADAQRKLGDVPWLSDAERRELAARGGAADVQYAADRCLHELFEAQAARSPDAIAVTWEGEPLSYRDLNRRANRLAQRLRAAGVGPDVLVGLCAERSIELVIGIVAIHKAGGAYLPLDPNYPPERLAFMMNDAQVNVLLAQDRWRSGLPQSAKLRVIALERDWDELDGAGEENLSNLASPKNLAYVIYTSGSTGKPKGALVSHYNVVRLFQAAEKHFQFGPTDVWTLFHSYAFDFSVWEIWGALLYGGRIVVVPHAVSRSPEEFTAHLQRERVTVLNQTPSAFRQLIPSFIGAVLPDQVSLRYVIFGGEALELQILQPWFECYGDQRPQMINMYGITETTVHVTYRRIRQEDLRAGNGSVIGKPLADLRVYLLNSRQQLVPAGVAGEIYVGGAGVARGYWQRPELTAEKFIDDPFSAASDGRLYRSGDLARWLPNGDLEYLGRIDDQVKIRGFRIELGEIEAVLTRHPEIKEAVVLARADTPGEKRLVAYVVPRQSVHADGLREFARATLPDYMVPAALVLMEKLPLTANGKLDRKALPAPDGTRPELQQAYAAPRGAVETRLCEIWSAVLGVERVGIHDNFFALGGDSILCIQVIAKARQAGLKVSAKELFKNPTVAQLAQTSAGLGANGSEPVRAHGPVALTPIQHWFFEQELAGAHHWNQSLLFATAADFDPAICEAALAHVARHHDSLRLRCQRLGAVWQQSYSDEAVAVAIERIDLSALPHAEQEAALLHAAAAVQASLDISSGPVIKVAHVRSRLGGRLLLVLHHLIVDAVSWRILLEDMETAYMALRSHRAVALPASTSSFQSWSERLRQHAGAAETRAELATWRAVAETGAVRLPVDLDPGGANLEASAQTVSARLTAAETRALLQRVPSALRSQINEILLAALTESFKGWHSGNSLLIDLEGHGREEIGGDIDLSRTVGWFTSIFPVRLDLRGDDLAASLRSVKTTLRSLRHHGLNYGVLRYLSDDAAVRRLLSGAPQAEVVFNYLGQLDQLTANSRLFRFAPESCGPQHSPAAERRHKIEVVAQVQHGSFEVRWIYSDNLHRRATIARLANQFIAALRGLIAQSETLATAALVPADFPLAEIEQPALDRLLRDYPAAQDIYPLAPVQKLFLSADAANRSLGLEQWHCEILGALDVAAFKQAWQALAERHTILRTAFVAEGLGEPLEVVNAAVSLPWVESDWSGCERAVHQQRLHGFLERDRELGFELDRAPLLRLALMRLAAERYQFVWTTHHLLIDGWSWQLVFKDLAALYDAAARGAPVPAAAACPYRSYIAWLQQQSLAAAETFWRRELAGIQAPTPLMQGAGVRGSGEERFLLEAKSTQALQDYARAQQVTLNSIMHAAWALVLSRLGGADEVVFGATFSGRPADAPGMETMVGPCITNLPVRLRLARQEPLAVWLRRHQEHLGELGQFQYVSPLEIHGWSEIPWHRRLFESLLVFQNYQTDDCDKQFGRGLTIDKLVGPYTTNYPLTVVVTPGPELKVWLVYQTPQFTAEEVAPVAAALKGILTVWATRREATWEDLMAIAAKLPMTVARHVARADQTPRSAPASAPQDEQQRRLLEIWREAFQRDGIGIDDNFFDLGGHSVLMVRTHERLRQVLHRDLSIVKMFQYPTIRALAQFLDGASDLNLLHERTRRRAEKQRAALGRNQSRGAITKR